jgi:addiction module RelE/StbE family toxin
MAFAIVWSQTAVEDLREVVRFIARDDPAAAASLADRILGHIELASGLPFSCRAVPEKDDKSIREIILRPYRIIYHVDGSQCVIHILRVWHAARGTPDLG